MNTLFQLFKKNINIILITSLSFVSFFSVYAGTLSCTMTTAAGCTGTIVLRMSSSTNAQAELASGSNFINDVVCCTGVSGLGTSCSGTFSTVVKLSSVTNAHVEENTQSNYLNNACISVAVGSTQIAYQNNNCTGYDTVLFSISSTTNAHVGTSTAYTRKVCGTADNVVPLQSISFNISTTTLSFGVMSSVAARFASSTGAGSSVEVTAHTLTASTSGTGGYQILVQGQTLTSLQNPQNVINAIGGVNTASTVGTEQFGLRVATTSGTGLISSPYNGAGFAYSSTATTSSVIGTGAGDGVTTVFSVRYIANIGPLTEAGSYSAQLIFTAVANF